MQVACAAVAGLGLSRVLFELFFPHAVWLGTAGAALGMALLAGVFGWWVGRALERRFGEGAPIAALAVAPFLPLLLNLQAVWQPQGSTLLSRLLLGGSLWLALAVGVALLGQGRRRLASLLLLAGALAAVYLPTMGRAVGRADTFEFQVVVPQLGIVHPTGYPLYMLLGKLFTLIPWGPVAWRINLASVVFGVVAAGLVFLFVWQLTRRSLPALLAGLAFGLGPTFWSQAVEAEVYALHAVVVGGVMWGVGRVVMGGLDRWRELVLVFLLVGLGLANHLTTVVLLPGVVLAAVFVWWGERDYTAKTPFRVTGKGRGARVGDGEVAGKRGREPRLRGVVGDGGRTGERGRKPRLLGVGGERRLWLLIVALVGPLVLYAYLPLRWAAVNGEAMGWGRFLDWVIGGRFQGALRLDAFLTDPSRYGVVGRLLMAEWQPSWLLLFAAVGFVWLVWRNWRLALIVGLTLAGYVFYGLSYYVADLAVFLLPAHLLLALMWGVGLAVVGEWGNWRLKTGDWGAGSGGRSVLAVALMVGVMGVLLNGAAGRWAQVDRSEADGGMAWAAGVLGRPLDEGAAILADSARFPPLYYLQQAEGLRPDLDIMVLPDEAAYRAELGARVAAGQTVYLARQVPGLEGQYHLRSAGPLVEVGREPLTGAPEGVVGSSLRFGDVRLLGYELEEDAAAPSVAVGDGMTRDGAAPDAAAPGTAWAVGLTLYWQAEESAEQTAAKTAAKTPMYVYTRWQGEEYEGTPIPAGGQHPANGSYPTVAWEAGEVVADYHLLPRPLLGEAQTLALQVALAPPFSAPGELQWQTVTRVTVAPPQVLPEGRALYAQVGGALLDAVQVAGQLRAQEALPVLLSGCGESGAAGNVRLVLGDAAGTAAAAVADASEAEDATGVAGAACEEEFVLRETVDARREAGSYGLWALAVDGGAARCHWLARASSGCRLATVQIRGAALPAGATNFGDHIALTALEVAESELQRGGSVTVDVTWQALAEMGADYTVFAQVVDAQDRIVGQIDTWPLQGTYPTSQWQAGEVVRDSYRVAITEEAPPGDYRLLLGWYLLATQERLPVLDESGAIVEDRVVVELE